VDPNETLKMLRNMVKYHIDGETTDWTEAVCTLQEISETFDELDKWITNGGFFPEDWVRVPKAIREVSGESS